MTRYKRIKYATIAKMVHKVACMYNHPMPLKEMIDDMQHNMHIGIDPKRVARLLDDKVVERYEYVDGVMKVTTMVIP